MKIIALIEKGEDGGYAICTLDNDNNLVGNGDSVLVARENFLKAYHELLASYKESGKDLPTELRNVEFVYKYDIPSFFNEFDFINVSQFAKRVGINPSLMRQYKSKSTYISQKQKKKIEEQLHLYAKDLLDVVF